MYSSLLLCLHSFGQNLIYINTDSLSNHVHLSVVDVIKRTSINDFTVTVYVGNDTITRTTHAAQDFSLSPYPGMPYRIMITKPGFDTLRADWTQPADTADVYIDFYMRKTGMTKAERKEAYRQSRKESHRVAGNVGGFQAMGAPKRHMSAWRVDIFMRNGGSGSAEYVK